MVSGSETRQPVSLRAPAHGRADRLLAMAEERRAQILAVVAIVSIVVGAGLHLAGEASAGQAVWRAAVALLALELAFEVGRTIVVRRSLGVDTIALVAMGGSLALHQELAGVLIGLMFSGGAALEAVASRRARRELTALVQRAPRVTQVRADGALREVAVEDVRVGDLVVVRTGEVVPVDGTVRSAEATLDTSTLTGEPLPERVVRGDAVLSGVANAGAPFEVRTERPASESAYAALVRLVERAQTERAPLMRIADRYAGVFLPVTLVVAGGAWLWSGDPVRGLAVVVVATPCPLILAAPIALVSGLSRAAREGIVIKGAGVIEALGRTGTVLFDKTGTVTVGTPDLRRTVATGPSSAEEVLRLAASVDRLSAHPMGRALERAAARSRLVLSVPESVREVPGEGIAGVVDGRSVAVGGRAYVVSRGAREADVAAALAGAGGAGEALVIVVVDRRVAGVLVMADELRSEALGAITRLRAAGVDRIVMASGDREPVVTRIGRELGVDQAYAEQSPEDKLQLVRRLRSDPRGGAVTMVGDGVNDAPALALADVGIAMGGAGATVSSESADAVITVDRIDRVADAVEIGRRSLTIARQSIVVGMGLSFAAMLVAAAGHLPPLAGALFQELVDVAVILNALRALRGPGADQPSPRSGAPVAAGVSCQTERAPASPVR